MKKKRYILRNNIMFNLDLLSLALKKHKDLINYLRSFLNAK